MANISKFKDKKTGEVYDLGPKTWEITLTEDQTDDIINNKQRFPLSDAEGASEAFNNAKEGDFIKVSYRALGVEINAIYTTSICLHGAGVGFVATSVAHSLFGFGAVVLGDIYSDGVNTFSVYTFE